MNYLLKIFHLCLGSKLVAAGYLAINKFQFILIVCLHCSLVRNCFCHWLLVSLHTVIWLVFLSPGSTTTWNQLCPIIAGKNNLSNSAIWCFMSTGVAASTLLSRRTKHAPSTLWFKAILDWYIDIYQISFMSGHLTVKIKRQWLCSHLKHTITTVHICFVQVNISLRSASNSLTLIPSIIWSFMHSRLSFLVSFYRMHLPSMS